MSAPRGTKARLLWLSDDHKTRVVERYVDDGDDQYRYVCIDLWERWGSMNEDQWATVAWCGTGGTMGGEDQAGVIDLAPDGDEAVVEQEGVITLSARAVAALVLAITTMVVTETGLEPPERP